MSKQLSHPKNINHGISRTLSVIPLASSHQDDEGIIDVDPVDNPTVTINEALGNNLRKLESKDSWTHEWFSELWSPTSMYVLLHIFYRNSLAFDVLKPELNVEFTTLDVKISSIPFGRS